MLSSLSSYYCGRGHDGRVSRHSRVGDLYLPPMMIICQATLLALASVVYSFSPHVAKTMLGNRKLPKIFIYPSSAIMNFSSFRPELLDFCTRHNVSMDGFKSSSYSLESLLPSLILGSNNHGNNPYLAIDPNDADFFLIPAGRLSLQHHLPNYTLSIPFDLSNLLWEDLDTRNSLGARGLAPELW